MGQRTGLCLAKVICGLTLLVATAAQAKMLLVDDFESYTPGESIHLKGSDDLGWGDPVPRWYVQRNSSILGDTGFVTVEEVDGDNALQIVNRDLTGEIDTIYLSASIAEHAIEDMGTIYFRFKASGPNDTLFCTNDLAPGYDYDGTGNTQSGDGFQGTTNYSDMMTIARLSGGEEFRARNGNLYENVDMGQEANVWQEMWILYDNVMSQAKYYICPEGGTPQLVQSTSGDWWGDRFTAGDGVYNLKWMVGMYPWPDANIETIVHIDTIGIDAGSWGVSECIADKDPEVCEYLPGDINKNGVIDLEDFVILKTFFGIGTTPEEGDINGDGEVDLADFVILKTNFGKTSECPPLID